MKQILVATDFSACASNAMEYAVELALRLNLELCAIHAIHTMEGVDNSVYKAIFIEDYYSNKRRALASWAANFLTKEEYKDIKVSTVCEVGSVSTVLTKYIDTHEVELLVIGTMGSTGIAGLFGSNASTMVEKTRIPTLVLPLETKLPINPVITVATDFSTDLSPEDVTGLNEIVRAFHSGKVYVLNVIETSLFKTNVQGENKMRALITGTELEFKYIQEDSAREGIMNFIQSNDTDILCVVKHHHNVIYRLFNRSTVSQVMNKSVKAVLVLHA